MSRTFANSFLSTPPRLSGSFFFRALTGNNRGSLRELIRTHELQANARQKLALEEGGSAVAVEDVAGQLAAARGRGSDESRGGGEGGGGGSRSEGEGEEVARRRAAAAKEKERGNEMFKGRRWGGQLCVCVCL